MGKKNYLIDGVSGAGKTTVAEELSKLGHQAVHGDRELRYRGNPLTGEPISPENYVDTPEWMSEHQLWDLKKIKSYIDDKDHELTFFCGGSRNHSQFIDFLDGVFILDVDRDVMVERIRERVALDPTNFGGKKEEMDLILSLHESKKDIPKNGIMIDANQILEKVVSDVLSQTASNVNETE